MSSSTAPSSSPQAPVAMEETPPRPKLKQQLKLIFAILAKVPLMARVAILHLLGLSEPSKHLDLRTELKVAVKFVNRDPGIQGRMWISKYAAPVPSEPDIRDALNSAIESLQMDPRSSMTPVVKACPEMVPIEAEWTGYRANVSTTATLPRISERDKFNELQKEVTSPVTILYFHGGAYYMCDPSTHRPIVKTLAKLTGGRCYSVRYRLAPQNPFPAALLDALISYMTLLYPPPDAYHEAVRPENIVFAGDSAGGNLSLALLQTIMEFHRHGRRIVWLGEARDVPLPAGAAVSSPWIDITLSSPSWNANGPYDYLPTAKKFHDMVIPPCDAWPADFPRKNLYVDDALVTHPLATLSMARDWKGCPPVYIGLGWELMADEIRFMARMLSQQGVKVVFEEYAAMPHCFASVLPDTPHAKRFDEGWAGFAKRIVEAPEEVKPRAVSLDAKTLKETEVDLATLRNLSYEDMKNQVLAEVERVSAVSALAMAKL